MTRRIRAIVGLIIGVASLGAAPVADAKYPDEGLLETKGVISSSALPGGGSDRPRDIASASQDARYVTFPAGSGTVVARIDPGSGEVARSRFFDASLTVPQVALDGSTSGLASDGGRLFLAQPLVGFPAAHTRFVVLDARDLSTHRQITLPGSFAFDAVSPDGRILYLVQYTSPPDPTRYLVRGYDVAREQLMPGPVVDPDEAGRPMTGRPITRAMSPDGQWAYTLYKGDDEPFVHALDTPARAAVCVDLPALEGYRGLRRIQLNVAPDGSSLDLVDRGSSVASVDTATFEVTTPSASTGSGGGGVPWAAIAVGTTLVALIAAALMARRRGRGPVAGDVT
jgi:DNA-binding beta-propeller fold protein YncE